MVASLFLSPAVAPNDIAADGVGLGVRHGNLRRPSARHESWTVTTWRDRPSATKSCRCVHGSGWRLRDQDDRFRRHGGMRRGGDRAVAIDGGRHAAVAMLGEVRPHILNRREDLRRATNRQRRARLRADALDFRRVGVRDRAVGRHEEQDVYDAARFEGAQERSVECADLNRGRRDQRERSTRDERRAGKPTALNRSHESWDESRNSSHDCATERAANQPGRTAV